MVKLLTSPRYANLTRLEWINLGGNSVQALMTLSNLTRLTYLRLDANHIRDISPLANLSLLEELWLNGNAITDITPLIGLKNLKKLRLADNPFHDFSLLLKLEGVELDIDLSRLDELNIVVEVPDPNLKQAIRETLSLPEDIPLTQHQMLRLKRLSAWDSEITDLTGLERATFLIDLGLCGNQIHDLRPLAGLIHLEYLSLCGNPISDITPLANLTALKQLNLGGNGMIADISPLTKLIKLEKLNLDHNQVKNIAPLANLTQLFELKLRDNLIVDFTPLANLINLRELFIEKNLGTDFSSLQGLALTEFRYDEICDIEPLLPPVRSRIENRSFPSVFQAWDDVVGLNHLTWEQRNVLHDLHFSPSFETIDWDASATEPTLGVATQLAGNLAHARQVRQRRLDQNPNMVFLRSFAIHERGSVDAFPPGSDFWLRDASGQIVRTGVGDPLSNFLKPEVQTLIVNRILGIERCGLYDGVMLDGFAHNGTAFVGRHLYPFTDEEIIQAYLNIFRAVREQVRKDFLILVNGGHVKPDRYTDFINGTFMEILKDSPNGYSRAYLIQLENTLFWAAENLREPRINCLEGDGMSIEPPDGRNNLPLDACIYHVKPNPFRWIYPLQHRVAGSRQKVPRPFSSMVRFLGCRFRDANRGEGAAV